MPNWANRRGVVPLDELGPDDVGVPAGRRPPTRALTASGVGRGVVVAEHEELGARDEVEHAVGGGAEALGSRRSGATAGGGQDGVDALGGVDRCRCRRPGRRGWGSPAPARAPQDLSKRSVGGVVRDDDGDHGLRWRGRLLYGFHDTRGTVARRRRGPPGRGGPAEPPVPDRVVGGACRPGISVDDVTDAVENTVYTAVGLGILGFQHLQVQRRQLNRSGGRRPCARWPSRSSAPRGGR